MLTNQTPEATISKMLDQIPTGTFPEVSKVSEAYPPTDCSTLSLLPCSPGLNGGETTFNDIPNGSTICTMNRKTVKATLENGVQPQEDSTKRRNMEGEANTLLGEKRSHDIFTSQESAMLSKQAQSTPMGMVGLPTKTPTPIPSSADERCDKTTQATWCSVLKRGTAMDQGHGAPSITRNHMKLKYFEHQGDGSKAVVVPPPAVADTGCKNWENSLVGYFIEKVCPSVIKMISQKMWNA
ncbi:unnamed protein product [Ilex paraguariensis]|uniref:Uncharacterized protein n=1 Tax=Ilex paraguariensis TaxID=185542 RepID=A0ABC8TUW2_9AQUA